MEDIDFLCDGGDHFIKVTIQRGRVHVQAVLCLTVLLLGRNPDDLYRGLISVPQHRFADAINHAEASLADQFLGLPDLKKDWDPVSLSCSSIDYSPKELVP